MSKTFNFVTFDAEELNRVLRVTIHKTGKLGFSTDAIRGLGIGEGMGVRIHKDGEDTKESLYMELLDSADNDRRAWRVIKAGDYYYLNTRALFDKIEEDYASKSVYYDLTPVEIDDKRIYRMNRKETKGRGREESLFEAQTASSE